MANYERTGTRDLWYSGRHRTWGSNLYMTDIDSLEIKFENGNLVLCALIEIKTYWDGIMNWQVKSQKLLADKAALPYFLVTYQKAPATFTVHPLNGQARKLVPTVTVMDEKDYIAFQNRIRE